jgi:flagellar biosynthetic protein FliP
MNKKGIITKTLIVLVLMLTLLITSAWAAPPVPTPAGQTIPIPAIGFNIKAADNPKDVAMSLQILFVLTILSLAPSLLIMLSAFTRIIIVLSFTRSALGTQQMPPNQVLIGLALFLTFFVMTPVIKDINEHAYQPYIKGEITQQVAFDKGMEPIRNFMYKHTRTKDMALFLNLSQVNQ